MKFYALGYAGRKPEQIKELVERLDAVVVDIRFSPRSRVPKWNKGPLMALLGDRYTHLRSWGNKNYKGGPIELVDYKGGLDAIKIAHSNLNGKSFVLMCMCGNPAICHRTNLAELLRRDGHEVEELPLPAETSTPQLNLF